MTRKDSALIGRAASVFLTLAFAVAPASALTLEDAVARLWAQSAQLPAQEQQVRLAELDRWRRFLPNEPQLLFNNTDDHTNVGWGLGETFAFPGKALALAGTDRARADFQRTELTARRYDLARLAAQTYVDGAVATAALEMQRQNVADLEALAASLRARYEAGLATQAEDISAELQLRSTRADLAAAEDHVAVSTTRLTRLLALAPSATGQLELPDDLSPALLVQLGGGTSDRLRAAAAAELAQSAKRAAWWNQLPDLSLSAVRNRYYYLPGSPNGETRTWTYGAAVTIPLMLPAYERAETRRAQSQADLDRSAAELAALSADSDISDAAREWRRSRKRLQELHERDRPMAEALMQSTLSSYKTGKLGFAELVLARKTLSDLRIQEVQMRGSVLLARLRCLDRCAEENP